MEDKYSCARMLNFLSKNKVLGEQLADEFIMSTQKEQSDRWAGKFVMLRFTGWWKIYICTKKYEWQKSKPPPPWLDGM